jgi:hypothetical protein
MLRAILSRRGGKCAALTTLMPIFGVRATRSASHKRKALAHTESENREEKFSELLVER